MSALPIRAYVEPDLDDQSEVERQLPPTPATLTHVRDVIDLYIEHLRARVAANDYTEYSLDRMQFELRRFGREFGHQALSQCRQHDLTRWFNLHPQWKVPDTKKTKLNAILSCFHWAFEEELIERCPYRKPKFLKKMKSKTRRPAATTEYVTLMRFGSKVLRRALFILRRTGLRPKEMRDLVWSEVKLDDEAPHIHLEKHKMLYRTSKDRKIGLDVATVNFLRALKRNQRGKTKDNRVFTNKRGTPWDRHTFARHLRRYCKRLGIDKGIADRVSAYGVRHRYVADGIKGGVTTRRIADQVGHGTTTMIDTVYGTSTREEEEHLNEVATEILQKRKRKKTPKPPMPQGDGFRQGTLFPEMDR